jgi:RNA polymerase sigma-70 factor (ECF subfamily)
VVIRRNGMYASAELPMHTQWNFAEIYREHRLKVLNLCSYLLNSRDAAEDAAHEVFLRVQLKINQYNPELSFSNWILKIASNYCLDILRRRGAERRLFGVDTEMPDLPSSKPTPLNEMLFSERGDRIRLALRSLSDEFRVPLVLAYYNDFSYEEIAVALDLPRNTVATRLFRGKQLLREKLKKEKPHELPE